MKPNFYFDIRMLNATKNGPGSAPAIPVMTRVVNMLHGMRRARAAKIAVAFPEMRVGERRHPGTVVRVFAESREELDSVVEDVLANSRVNPYVQLHYPRAVPKDFKGKWIEYRRFRVSGTAKADPAKRVQQLAESEKLPYFRLSSKQTGQVFSLHVVCVPVEAPEDYRETVECEPDSYGLSVEQRSFALPLIR